MTDIAQFRAQLETDEAGGARVRIAPFGETVDSPYGRIRFEPDSITMPDGPVPFTIDHGPSVLDRVGTITRADTDKAMYGLVTFADTDTAQTVRELMKAGAVTDVSVGIAHYQVSDGVMSGVMDHVSAVDHGRFGNTENPSKVLAVHQQGEPPMAEPTEAAPEVATHTNDTVPVEEFNALAATVADLRTELDTVNNRVVAEEKPYRSLGQFVKDQVIAQFHGDAISDTERQAARDRLAKFAMSADTTTTGAGAVPDYLADEFLSVLATDRPFSNSIPSDPIGSYGMTVSYPTMGTKPTVAAQSSELDQPDSTTTSVTTTDFDLATYAGANRVAQQLIARSQPSFVDILIRELVSSYNSVTDAAGIATVLAASAAAHTAAVADLGADGAATFAAFQAANTAIIADMREPADTVWLAADRWAELNSLVDSDGRPILVFPANGPANAAGQSGLNQMVAQYHGWNVILVPDAADETCLIGIADKAAVLESERPTLTATNVDTLSTDFGIWGLYIAATKHPNAFYDITAS